jgi:membrane protein YqaA with SNARE-associated domain
MRWLQGAMRRYGAVVVFLGAFIPNPLFDAIGVIAGATRTSLWLFCSACFAGKALRFGIVAFGGTAVFAWMGHHPIALG